MKDDKRDQATGASIPNRILGSLRDALAAASRDATGEITVGARTEILPKDPPAAVKAALDTPAPAPAALPPPPAQSAADALREAKAPARGHYEASDPTTRVVRGKNVDAALAPAPDASGRTQVIRGKPKVARHGFEQDPWWVGW